MEGLDRVSAFERNLVNGKRTWHLLLALLIGGTEESSTRFSVFHLLCHDSGNLCRHELQW